MVTENSHKKTLGTDKAIFYYAKHTM